MAIQIWVMTVFLEVPGKLLIFKFCLIQLKKQFDLPTRLVDLGNSTGIELEAVGQKIVLVVGFEFLKTNPA